jgi:hypothetical protein
MTMKCTIDLLISSYLRWMLRLSRQTKGKSQKEEKKGAKAIVATSAKMLRIIY